MSAAADFVTVELWTGWRSAEVREIRLTLAGPYLLRRSKVPKAKGVLLWQELMLTNRKTCEQRLCRGVTWSKVWPNPPRKRPESTI